MFLKVIIWFLGILVLQYFPVLPSFGDLIISLIICVVIYYFFGRFYRINLLCVFICGLTWSGLYANSILAWQLSESLEGKPLLVNGYINSLPENSNLGKRVEFQLLNIYDQNIKYQLNEKIRLTIHGDNFKLVVGDEWQFLVKIKKIHGTQNPASFDFETWAFQNGIRAQGYVIASQFNKLLSHHWYVNPVGRLRQYLQKQIEIYSPHSSTSPWLMALMIGVKDNIDKDSWAVLRKTGTNHLMAIAGLHVGLLSGIAHYVFAWCWKRNPTLLLKIPAQHAGAIAALFVGILYGLLSGFALPTQRACLMLCFFIIAILLRRQINPWHAWSGALVCVLLINPLTVLSDSFWLSFCTLAIIFYGMSARLYPAGLWWKWGRVQWVIGVGLIPISLVLFQECSLTSFFANTIAIPWLGFLILPLCFLSNFFLLIWPSVAGLLLRIADMQLTLLWKFLTSVAHLPISSWYVVIPNPWVLIATHIAILIFLFPAGFPGRILSFLWITPLIFYQPEKPKHQEFWLTLLDVGQGLSAVIQTKNHLLLYDAGPKYSGSIDMGESVVLPYLRTLRRNNLDMLVLSHGDMDHIGGAQSVISGMHVKKIKTSVPKKLAVFKSDYCQAGDSWEWDGVVFSFLYPTKDNLLLRNDSSCVLSVTNGKQQILLTGDIESHAERVLVANNSAQLKSSILIAPHHGSKTSGLPAFISAVSPKIVLFATGYKNRYRFPNPKIVAAYNQIHARGFNTVKSGAITFKLKYDEKISEPVQYRKLHHRYWYSE